jgi:hypothetical protein
MKINVKVFPTLKKYLPTRWADQTEFEIGLQEIPGYPKTVERLIELLGLPPKAVGMIILNGHIKRDKSIVLQAGDRVVLSIFIGGG